MRARWLGIWGPAFFWLAACSAEGNSIAGRDGGRDARTDARVGDASSNPDGSSPPCTDSDGDGIADRLESTTDIDSDGVPADRDDDSDGDGFLDRDEAIRDYAGSGASPLTCGQTPDDCDMDGVINSLDLDSDNDGLTDVEEREARTNPCTEDTDGDGVPDLTERAAGSDPTMSASTPPTNALYVTLPYHPPGEMGMHERREFTFSTRIRAADIFFVVDTTGSMSGTINQVRTTLSSTIIPGIVRALGPGADARYGMAAHGDFQEGGYNYAGNISILQRLTPDSMAVQRATSRLNAEGGGDGPESQVPAMYALLSGRGTSNFCLPPDGGADPGCVRRDVNIPTDCGVSPDDVMPYGWGCFRPDRVPIIVLLSDAPWHNGPGGGNDYPSTPSAGTYEMLRAEMVRRGAYFVGIQVGSWSNDTYTNSLRLAADTNTRDGAGRAIAFDVNDNLSMVAPTIVDAITTIAGQSRQDITTRTDPDRMEMRLMAPHTTADFIKAVTPVRGIPEAPMGYDRHDMTTFYNVAPSTQVVFAVDFYNDFQPGGSTAQLFRATIVVLGRAGAPVDRREVYIIVPAAGGGPPG